MFHFLFNFLFLIFSSSEQTEMYMYRILSFQFPIFLGMKDNIDEVVLQKVERSCEILNAYLDGNDFVAGDNLTIADFSISTSIVVLEVRYN